MTQNISKFFSKNRGFLIRFDDIAENMKWEYMELSEKLFDKYNIKPILGVIPCNKDPELLALPSNVGNFWNQVRDWKKKGWEIAMHGTNHVYDRFCDKKDYLAHGGNTEFYGHTFEDQLKKIEIGINKFRQEKIDIKTFFSPNHTFDKNTIKALKKFNILNIVDGYGIAPYQESEINFIPQLFYNLKTLPFGIQTIQIHLNYFKDEDFYNFENFIEKNYEEIITIDQALSKINNGLLHTIIRHSTKKIFQIKRAIHK